MPQQTSSKPARIPPAAQSKHLSFATDCLLKAYCALEYTGPLRGHDQLILVSAKATIGRIAIDLHGKYAGYRVPSNLPKAKGALVLVSLHWVNLSVRHLKNALKGRSLPPGLRKRARGALGAIRFANVSGFVLKWTTNLDRHTCRNFLKKWYHDMADKMHADAIREARRHQLFAERVLATEAHRRRLSGR